LKRFHIKPLVSVGGFYYLEKSEQSICTIAKNQETIMSLKNLAIACIAAGLIGISLGVLVGNKKSKNSKILPNNQYFGVIETAGISRILSGKS
jgi:hypothetical protein